MLQRLFVYGTLRPGESNQHFLAAIPGTWMSASIRGVHFPHGYGATEGYPVIAPTQLGLPIAGMILEAQFTQEQWQTLDDFESEAYKRVLSTAVAANGEELSVFVYVLNSADLERLALELPSLGLGLGPKA
ncbi:MAG: gamma-glutamylcyclotransferase (GGCT)/AIG2-like uncharacterized protein YtfP [Pseudohongiellaceae bacterium]|jgi:gamma-glutamylcyclotransferase (GGCT)/AIG2-like uncharacterized protein YtfP